jgi:hypothetical protein
MSPVEWRTLAHSVNRNLASMARAAKTSDEVRKAQKQRAPKASEEPSIVEVSLLSQSNQPSVFTVGAVELKVWKTHRAGLSSSDIKGTDLYYEIFDKKFNLVQYKAPNSRGRVSLDANQLDELQDACPVQCPPTHRYSCGS